VQRARHPLPSHAHDLSECDDLAHGGHGPYHAAAASGNAASVFLTGNAASVFLTGNAASVFFYRHRREPAPARAGAGERRPHDRELTL